MELSAADEEYLSAHPAVHDVIECIVLECLRARPDDVQRHIASFVGKNLARSVSLSRRCVTLATLVVGLAYVSHVSACIGDSAVACRREGFTLEEVGRHNSEEDAWIAVRGKVRRHSNTLCHAPCLPDKACPWQVYECTHFFSEHPGGKAELLRGIGKDATELFNAAHSHVSPDKRLGVRYRAACALLRSSRRCAACSRSTSVPCSMATPRRRQERMNRRRAAGRRRLCCRLMRIDHFYYLRRRMLGTALSSSRSSCLRAMSWYARYPASTCVSRSLTSTPHVIIVNAGTCCRASVVCAGRCWRETHGPAVHTCQHASSGALWWRRPAAQRL